MCAPADVCLHTQAHRHRQASLAVLLCWQEYVQHKRRKRQLLLRAEACYVFVTLLRVLQQWRARTTDKQLARIKAARCGRVLSGLRSAWHMQTSTMAAAGSSGSAAAPLAR
jgi:hypothetical protein